MLLEELLYLHQVFRDCASDVFRNLELLCYTSDYGGQHISKSTYILPLAGMLWTAKLVIKVTGRSGGVPAGAGQITAGETF